MRGIRSRPVVSYNKRPVMRPICVYDAMCIYVGCLYNPIAMALYSAKYCHQNKYRFAITLWKRGLHVCIGWRSILHIMSYDMLVIPRYFPSFMKWFRGAAGNHVYYFCFVFKCNATNSDRDVEHRKQTFQGILTGTYLCCTPGCSDLARGNQSLYSILGAL